MLVHHERDVPGAVASRPDVTASPDYCSGSRKQRSQATRPGRVSRLHLLKGDRAGQSSVRDIGNCLVVFRSEDNEAADVDLIDYH
ncbi:MAG: hypothetical protein OXS50_10935 [Gammaproteobacteria bacterium]|nr:hypothetical protein [Gammaproteobacteria bacterium]